MKKIFALILAGLLAVSMVSCGNKDENEENNDESAEIAEDYIEETNKHGKFEYKANDEGDYEITKYESYSVTPASITLPKEVNGREIVGIAKEAFKADNSIKEVTVPATYKYISDYAFYDCDSLTKIALPSGLEEIGIGAFGSCDTLADFTVPASVKVISEFTFKDCIAIKSLDLSNVTTINKGAFQKCSNLETIKLDKIEYATKEAFYGCDKLQYNKEENGNLLYLGNDTNKTLLLVSADSLTIDECTVSATTVVVADKAFNNCSYLKKIILSDSIKALPGQAFANCTVLEYTKEENGLYLGSAANPHMVLAGIDLKSVEDFKLNKDVKIICDNAFEGYHALEDISFEGTEAEWNAIVKSAEWNGNLTVNVTCSDKVISVLG